MVSLPATSQPLTLFDPLLSELQIDMDILAWVGHSNVEKQPDEEWQLPNKSIVSSGHSTEGNKWFCYRSLVKSKDIGLTLHNDIGNVQDWCS